MQVIKVGTSSLVRIEKKSINISALSLLCETVRNLKEQGQASSLRQPVAGIIWLSKQAPTGYSLECTRLTGFDTAAAGHRVVIVSSGAVGVGCQRLGLAMRPKELAKRQALAAAGQVHLMRYYDDFFSAIGLVNLSCCKSHAVCSRLPHD